MCLAFVGQAMASTMMSYHMMSMGCMKGQEQSQDMPMMDHSNHAMMAESSNGNEATFDNCCANTCSCFTSGCSSFTVFMSDTENALSVDALSFKILSHSNLAQKQQPTSLFRPPILS